MTHATSWERAAEQLHTAATDIIGIAARREGATSEPHPGQEKAPGQDPETCKATHAEGWMSALLPPGNGSVFDPAVAHPARIYDYWLGGKDHFDADRTVAEEVMRLRPQVAASVRANRAFLARVIRYLAAGCGIRQFLDIGAGLPAVDNTHEVAQRTAPDSKVVYCDNDRLVLSHARALLTSTTAQGICEYVEADLRDPETILAQAAQTLDFTQPVAILLLAVAHFLADRDRPAEIVATLASALAPGSYVAISHLTADLAPEPVAAAVTAYNSMAPVPVAARTHAQVTALFGELPLLPPGVVPASQWRPPIGAIPQPCDLYVGVAYTRQAHR